MHFIIISSPSVYGPNLLLASFVSSCWLVLLFLDFDISLICGFSGGVICLSVVLWSIDGLVLKSTLHLYSPRSFFCVVIISRFDSFPVLYSALVPVSLIPGQSIIHPITVILLQCFGVFFPFCFMNQYAYSSSVSSPLNYRTLLSSILGHPIPLQLFFSGAVVHGCCFGGPSFAFVSSVPLSYFATACTTALITKGMDGGF